MNIVKEKYNIDKKYIYIIAYNIDKKDTPIFNNHFFNTGK
jgi:hypothetical protein